MMENSDNKVYVIRCGTTPEQICWLDDDEVFVFGSNLQGCHAGGAAAFALKHFGAEWGVGGGMQGHAYAIPTMHGGVKSIRPYVDQFIAYARKHDGIHFYVTKIGCGIAGFRTRDIAPLFVEALEMPHVSLPKEFIYDLRKLHKCITLPEYLETYGQLRTIVDMLKAFNADKPITSVKEAREAVNVVLRRSRLEGTVTSSVYRAVHVLLCGSSCPEKFDLNVFVSRLLSSVHICGDVYENIVQTRGVAKLYKIIRLMNKVRHYQSIEVLYRDIFDYVFAKVSFCARENWLYDTDMGADQLKSILKATWSKLSTDGQLDNHKVEALFGEFDRKVQTEGIESVVRENYRSFCNDDTFYSSKYGYPDLIKHDGGLYDIKCGENDPGLLNSYEWTHLEEFIKSEKEYGHCGSQHVRSYYCGDYSYYYPRTDDSRPIFIFFEVEGRLGGEMIFKSEAERKELLRNLRKNI